jgi:hypothetical protein
MNRAWTMLLFGLLQAPLWADETIPAEMDRDKSQQTTLATLEKLGQLSDTIRPSLDDVWNSTSSTTEAIARSIALVDEEIARSLASSGVTPTSLSSLDPFFRSNVALWLADERVKENRLDDAAEYLTQADPSHVADRGRFHFLQFMTLFPLGKQDEAKMAIEQLRRLDPLPRRYLTLADSIQRRIEQTDPESLEAIANDMRDVRRRLDLGEVGTKVRTMEDDVVRRLDVLIKKVEEKQETPSPTAQPSQPNAPADESRLAGAQGEGLIDAKRLGDKRAWGNLPAKEREKTLQEIGRDLPGPYRSAVEEYFRKLAESRDGGAP